jgi:hypothetical protein
MNESFAKRLAPTLSFFCRDWFGVLRTFLTLEAIGDQVSSRSEAGLPAIRASISCSCMCAFSSVNPSLVELSDRMASR